MELKNVLIPALRRYAPWIYAGTSQGRLSCLEGAGRSIPQSCERRASRRCGWGNLDPRTRALVFSGEAEGPPREPVFSRTRQGRKRPLESIGGRIFQRGGRDSNPRLRFKSQHSLSRRAQSATLAPPHLPKMPLGGRQAEGVGFEPTVACATTVFKTVTFSRSVIPPSGEILP